MIDEIFPILVKKNIHELIVAATYVLDINSLDKWEVTLDNFSILDEGK